MQMQRFRDFAAVYAIGSVGYSAVEILWRGFTHWTMAITGGVCFTLLHLLNGKMRTHPLWKKCLAGSGVITAVEFTAGCIVNLTFHMVVWDYSAMAENLLGQICPLYSVLWFLLCIPVMWVSNALYRMKPNGKGLFRYLSESRLKQLYRR